jgi:GAF domain-containing protein
LDGATQVKAVPLRKCFDQHEIDALLKGFCSLGAQVLGIADADGVWLAAYPSAPDAAALVQQAASTRCEASDLRRVAVPLVVEETLYGVLYGDLTAAPFLPALREVLTMLIQKAQVQKALAGETLDRYREINLLYRAHETIGSSLDLEEVIRRVLQESARITKASGGSVLVLDGVTNRLTSCDSVGFDVARAEQSLMGGAFSDEVFETGKPRILNNMDHLMRPGDANEVQLVSLLGAPLRSSQGVLGVITLARIEAGATFTAGDEKLLTALASQAGIAIANAREVQARERRLKQQIEALRIEIDESKKQREVFAITENEYFAYLQENAQHMRAEFDL